MFTKQAAAPPCPASSLSPAPLCRSSGTGPHKWNQEAGEKRGGVERRKLPLLVSLVLLFLGVVMRTHS